jgi:hypothetical protein
VCSELFPGFFLDLSWFFQDFRDLSEANCTPGTLPLLRRTMKTTPLPPFLRGVPLLLTTALAPMGLWAQPQECPLQNATLDGAYVSHATGFSGGNPIAVVGITTYDGQGNFQLRATVSVNGTILRPPIGTGTYTVNRDCTGSQTIRSAHYDFVVTPDGREVTYISTDPGNVITVTSVRLVSKGEREDD